MTMKRVCAFLLIAGLVLGLGSGCGGGGAPGAGPPKDKVEAPKEKPVNAGLRKPDEK
jgi:hypothetical protein